MDGKVLYHFPSNLEILKYSEPVYEELRGWKTEIKGAKNFKDLPTNTRRYLKRIEKLIGTKITMISVGSERDETVEVKNPFLKKSRKR